MAGDLYQQRRIAFALGAIAADPNRFDKAMAYLEMEGAGEGWLARLLKQLEASKSPQERTTMLLAWLGFRKTTQSIVDSSIDAVVDDAIRQEKLASLNKQMMEIRSGVTRCD